MNTTFELITKLAAAALVPYTVLFAETPCSLSSTNKLLALKDPLT